MRPYHHPYWFNDQVIAYRRLQNGEGLCEVLRRMQHAKVWESSTDKTVYLCLPNRNQRLNNHLRRWINNHWMLYENRNLVFVTMRQFNQLPQQIYRPEITHEPA